MVGMKLFGLLASWELCGELAWVVFCPHGPHFELSRSKLLQVELDKTGDAS